MSSKKSSVDLDFGDITSPAKKKIPKKEEKKKKEESKLSGLMLSIPVAHDKFLVKDLVECTPEEFLSWASFVYPDTSRVKAEDFRTISARKAAFKQALAYHINLMTKEEKDAIH